MPKGFWVALPWFPCGAVLLSVVRFLSAAAQSSSGDLGGASMPLNFCLIVFQETEDCRKAKGDSQRGIRCTRTGGAKSATTRLSSASATKAV